MVADISKTRQAKQVDPVSAASRAFVTELELHRKAGSGWLTLPQLVEHVPGLTADVAQSALLKNPSKQRVIVAFASDPNSPVILKDDLESFATDGHLLKLLAQLGCSAASPKRQLTELTAPLEKRIRSAADKYWPDHSDQLPGGLVGIGKKKQFAIYDERFPLPDQELARRFVVALKALRSEGELAYPSTWKRLLDTIGESPDDNLVRQATAATPFAGVARSVRSTGEIWIAFAEDAPSVISSPAFLQRLMLELCTEAKPEIRLSGLVKQLPKDLQSGFVTAWQTAFEQQREIGFADIQTAGTAKKRDVQFRDRRFPLPEIALSEKLVRVLESQKAVAGSSYPTTWQRLTELTDPNSLKSLQDKARQSAPFCDRAIVSLVAEAGAPVALTGDEDCLANSPLLLRAVVDKLRSNDNHAVDILKIVKLKGIHPGIVPLFQSAIERQVASKHLPAGIGALKLSKKLYLFRMSDIVGTNAGSGHVAESKRALDSSLTPGSTTAYEGSAENFAADFDAAFVKLDGKLGLPNYASLVDLRPAMKQHPRDDFDRGLLELRKTGRYSLSIVEGRFGISDDERAAAIVIDHTSYLLVHRKR